MMKTLSFLAVAVAVFISGMAQAARPDPKFTPGKLCTPQDPDFTEYRYPAHIAYCGRNVSHEEKLKVAQEYGGIPESEWPNYEFDHLIPLNAGGANDITNLWPQPLAEAHVKDKLEDEIYKGLSSGSMTQDEAVQKIQDWIQQQDGQQAQTGE